ncbi:DNA-processing protein DprA [Lacticaseibacillus porcinae]|uniref:DNA-processing protein DprA n=1 Tax=Lacticaseibacillus porcinae TaxID=1123687 RepID=UPI000F7900BD|nr:DNA-processing protein DprA [Lacticaseibacillus porcinae]
MQIRDFLFLWHLATYTKGFETQNLAFKELHTHAGTDELEPMQLSSELYAVYTDDDLKAEARHQYRQLHFITCLDPEYPERLKESFEPPSVLFYLGNIKLLNTLSLAIVGARNATEYTPNALNKLAPQLKAVTIVSGLAQGADAYAHQFALSHHLPTIAVIANGLDVAYPKANQPLQQQIATQGLLLSEYPLGVRPQRYMFVMRNRIIAGLVHGLLVTEAAERSGSLITANLALQNNREVFALPGNIDHAKSAGTNLLIQAGAKLVTTGDDIIEEIKFFS